MSTRSRRADRGPGSASPTAAWWRDAVQPRLDIARHVPHVGAGLIAVVTAVNVALGVLPIVFVITSSVMVGLVPAAIEQGTGSPSWTRMIYMFLAAAGAFLGRQVLTPLQIALGELVKRRVDGRVIDEIVAVALRSPGIAVMEDQAALDDLKLATSRLEHGTETPGIATAGLLALAARYLQLAGFTGIVVWAAGWPAGLALLATVLLFRRGQRGGLRRFSKVWEEVAGLIRRGDYLREVATGPGAAKEVRIYGLHRWLTSHYQRVSMERLRTIWRWRRRVYLQPYLYYSALGVLGATYVVFTLTDGVAAGTVSLTALSMGLQAVIAGLMLGAAYPESDVPTQFGMVAESGLRRFQARVAEDLPHTAAGAGSGDATGRPARSVRFVDVSFAYAPDSPNVLDGLDLELPAGRCTAIVGVNGAGKTTLVKLLTRLYEPTSGRIEVDGADLRSYDVDGWRRQVSVVFQDFIRYELSLADNVAYGAPHAARDDREITAALADVGLLGLAEELPLRLDTPLSRLYPGGIDLSGGQWQRIAIARAMYALRTGARLLVLDEPTSAMDVRAEAAFLDRFVDLVRGATTVLISHRLSSVQRADQIIVIDGGRVAERGTHEELMALPAGRYGQLYRLQAERFNLTDDRPRARLAPTRPGRGTDRDRDA